MDQPQREEDTTTTEAEKQQLEQIKQQLEDLIVDVEKCIDTLVSVFSSVTTNENIPGLLTIGKLVNVLKRVLVCNAATNPRSY